MNYTLMELRTSFVTEVSFLVYDDLQDFTKTDFFLAEFHLRELILVTYFSV